MRSCGVFDRLNIPESLALFSFPARVTPLSAWHTHIPFGMYLVSLLQPRVIVELGVAAGDSYCAFCQAVDELNRDTRCFGIDTWESDPHTGFYGPEVLEELQRHHDPRYGRFSTLIRRSFDEALNLFEDGSIDLLHIDGYHTYDAVKHDFESWLPKMSDRGVVLLHDIAEHRLDFGVWRLWAELKSQYPHFEFLHGHGLGILAVGSEIPKGLRCLLTAPPEDAIAVRALFAFLGSQVRPGPTSDLQMSFRALAEEFLVEPGHQVSIVIPVYNNLHLTRRCLECIRENTAGVEYELIVVDNGSTDGTRGFLLGEQMAGRLRAVINDSNLGFAAACNMGAAEARGRYVVFLNNDTEPQAGWLRALVETAEADERIAVVGAKLLYPDGTVQHAGVAVGRDLSAPISPFHIYHGAPADAPWVNREKDLQVVTGACMLVRRDLFLALGGFDEAFRNGYEDVDLCLRAVEAGYRVVYCPRSTVIHLESQTPGRFAHTRENIVLLHRKWLGRVRFDHEDILLRDGLRPPDPPKPAGAEMPACSFVVIARDAIEVVGSSMRRLFASLREGDEVILVDLGSADMTREYLEMRAQDRPGTRLLDLGRAHGFSGAVREGLARASREDVIVMEAGVFGEAGWIERLLPHLGGSSAAGPLLVERGLSPQRYELYAGPVALREEWEETLAGLQGILAVRNPGRSVEARRLEGFCLAARRDSLAGAAGDVPDGLCPRCTGAALAAALRLAGHRVAIAADAVAARPGRPWEEEAAGHGPCSEILVPWLAARLGWGNVPPPEELLDAGWLRIREEHRAAFRDRLRVPVLTSIVIPVRGGLEVVRACIRSVLLRTPDPIELIIVDDASDGLTRAYLESLASGSDRVRVVRSDRPLGFPGACNLGIAAAGGEAVLILNSDTVVTEGWLWRLHRCLASEPDVGIVGPVSNNAAPPQLVPDCPYRTGEELEEFSRRRAAEHCGMYLDSPKVTGVCMLIRRPVIDRIGGFDPRFSPGNFEDDDFCLRARIAGFRIKVALDTFIHHEGSRTFALQGIDPAAAMERNLRLFLRKWGLPETLPPAELYDHLESVAAARSFDPEEHRIPIPAPAAAGR